MTVDCPGRQENEAGRTFTCTASENRHRRTVVIRIEADDTYSATVRTQSSP